MGEIKAGDNCLGKSKRGTNPRPPNMRGKPRVSFQQLVAIPQVVLSPNRRYNHVAMETKETQKKRRNADRDAMLREFELCWRIVNERRGLPRGFYRIVLLSVDFLIKF